MKYPTEKYSDFEKELLVKFAKSALEGSLSTVPNGITIDGLQMASNCFTMAEAMLMEYKKRTQNETTSKEN